MPGRKRKHSDASFESDNGSSDEDYAPRKSSRRGGKSSGFGKATKQKTTGDREPVGLEDNASSLKAKPHAQTLHTILSPAVMRDALTVWFDGVRNDRGMPWRKPYNPDLDADQRAQRAYEVLVFPSYVLLCQRS